MLSNSRIINLLNKCTELNKKFDDGIAIECGVANGGSLQVMREYFSENISIYGFDSFSNMPPLTEKDENDARAIKMNFNITNNKLVGNIYGNKEKCIAGFKKNSIPMENVKLIEGYFEETIPSLIDELNNIILLRLDADWYQSTYYLLDTLYDKVVKGGVIIIDDFYAYVDCRKAVIDFFNNRKIDLPYIFHTYEKGLTTITGGTEIFWYK